MKKINIAEPCHEKWNDFTPTEKGAFCGKCKIDVVDFSNKSNLEIKNILDINSGKHMCGRFKTTQLSDFNSDYTIWQNQSQSTFQSKFIFAVILGFGLTLFSCSNDIEAEQMNQITTQVTDTTNHITPISIEDSISTTIINDTITKSSCSSNTNIKPVETIMNLGVDEIMGGIKYTEDILLGEIDYSEEPTHTKGKVAIVTEPIPKTEPMIMGKIAAPNPSENIYIENNTSDITNNKITIEATIFPNPIINKAKLNITVKQLEHYKIDIFNEQGQLIQTLYNDILHIGNKSFKINLSQKENGIYFVNIKTEHAKKSLKIIKSK